jgi:hypothetical protein
MVDAAAGGHLDLGAAFVGGEGFLEVADGFDLRRPEITFRHLIGGHKIGEAGVELVFGLEVLQQRLGFMKREDVATFRRGIELVGELRFDADRFVGKGQRVSPLWVNLEQAFAVLDGLFFYTGQSETFGFGFDCPDGFAVDK